MAGYGNTRRRSRKRRPSTPRAGSSKAAEAPAATAGTRRSVEEPPAGAGEPAATQSGPRQAAEGRQRPYSRSEARNAEARASLEPLREGERPRAVTVGAIVACLLAAASLVPYLAGIEIGGERPSPLSFIFPFVLLVAAWGMWRSRYWAVLGMQAILAFLLIGFSLNLMYAVVNDELLPAAGSLAVVAGAGVLFWFMVKAMARIQMPERR